MKIKTFGAFLFLAVALAAAAQAGKVINAKCPVKSDQAAKPGITSTYKGSVIGFC